MSADILALIEKDPAAGILAAADLREQRAKAATEGPYRSEVVGQGWSMQRLRSTTADGEPYVADYVFAHDAEHIAAEANPAHALAAVRRWKRTAGRHVKLHGAPECMWCGKHWHCPDIRETADEARAYLGAAPEPEKDPA